jgi:hypothetical protein
VPAGETEKDPSGLTVDTLHLLMQQQINDLRRSLDERYEREIRAIGARFDATKELLTVQLDASKQAVKVAEDNAQRWRDQANEWRGAMDDREKTYMTRNEHNQAMKTSEDRNGMLADRVDKLETWRDIQGGGQSKVTDQRAVFGLWVVGATFVLAVVIAIANYLSSH